jgi:RHS repeat-associated protein
MKKLILLLFLLPVVAFSQTTGQNYIKNTTYKVGTATSITSPTTAQAKVQITYFDGLGRPIEQIQQQQSGTSTNIVTYTEYDSFGRQAKDYLPFVSTATDLSFVSGGKGATNLFYTTYGETTTNPLSRKLLENSPLNRVLKQAAPGNAWVCDTVGNIDHSIKFAYASNAASEVRMFSATGTYSATYELFSPAMSLTGTTYYAAAKLYKTVTKDENWTTTSGTNNTTEEFKDYNGRVVLKRTYGLSYINPTTESVVAHDTYYVYDQFGNLTYVIPPKVDLSTAPTQAVLDGLCYQYKYDYRNRMVEKKLPGQQWQFIVYDKLDRVIATGPAFSPFSDSAASGWLFTKYDSFNRPVYTGWLAVTGTFDSAARKTLQNARTVQTTNFSEDRLSTTTDVTISGVALRYPNTAWPTGTAYTVLTVNYYDNYSFTNGPSTIPTTVMTDASQKIYYNSTKTPKGLTTGSYVRIPELSTTSPAHGNKNYILYDNKGRGVRSYKTNYLGGYTQNDTRIDSISGNILFTETKHKRISSAAELFTTDTFTYTSQNRPFTHTHKIGTNPTQLLSANTYDKLGKLTIKMVGGTEVTGSKALQKIDYAYNMRGWLTRINNVDGTETQPANITQEGDPYDLFRFKINYNTVANSVSNNVTALYNGNISETFWRTGSDNIKRAYGYNYDAMNRLHSAYYQKPSDATPLTGSYDENIRYDKNGNIMYLNRTGDFDDATLTLKIDSLSYVYDTANPNKLIKATDSSGNTSGFSDGANTATEYTYDANGNMMTDANKGITSITYNHINLPITITITGGSISYLYNALGEKVKKTVTEGSVITTTDYLDGYQYDGGTLLLFPTSEGYVANTSGVYSYIYQYKDHLGNNRLNFGLDTNNHVVILEENNYYPFGLKHKNYNVTAIEWKNSNGSIDLDACDKCMYKYKYNGKELQDELGLNLYNYGARNYDPALGRWMNIDPLAENSRRFSPYNYALNNPVYFMDPDGMDIVAFFQKDENGKNKGQSEYENIVNQGLGGQFKTKFTQNDNGSLMVSLEATEGGGDISKLSDEQRSFYESMNNIANDHNSLVVQDVVVDDENVQVGSFVSNKIDVGDMSKYNGINDKGHTGSTAQGLLVHETDEQYEFTKVPGGMNMSKQEKANNFDGPHAEAKKIENKVNGNERLPGETEMRNTYTKTFRENNGATTTEKMTTHNKNMTVDKSTTNK